MTLLEIFLIGIGLSMDAFAVAICKGLAMPDKVDRKGALLIALYFGVFQAVMPALGWLLGSQFARYVTQMAPWIAFVLLAWIGGSMIRESLSKEEKEEAEMGAVSHKELLVLAVATSIDALAVGVTFSVLELAVSIGAAVALIGCTTFVISLGGVYVGNVFGARYKGKAEFVGGAILILIGVKILLEHFGVL
jgi:manganese efflux pump family protein